MNLNRGNIITKTFALIVLFIGTALIMPFSLAGLNILKVLFGYWVVYKAIKIWKQED